MPTVCVIKSRKYPLGEGDIVDGGTLNAHVIVGELRRSGYDVEVFTRDEGNEQAVVNQPGTRVFRVPFVRSASANVLLRDYEEGESFVEGVLSHREFKPERYACIHTHHWTSGVGLGSRIPAQTKLIHTPHLLAAEKARYNGLPLPPHVGAAERALLDRANHVIAVSESEAAAMRTTYGCDARKIVVAPNAIDAAFFAVSPLHAEAQRPLPILYIGRSCRQKGIDVLLDAAERVVESGMPVSLRIVGGPYGEPDVDRSIEERIHRPPLAGIVERIGEVAHGRVPSLLRDCFVYAQPSRYESQGVALLEAMAAGRVVVTSDLPAIREYIRHGENGFLVEPENPRALADALRAVLANPEQALPLARAARETAATYTWRRMLQAVIPLFSSR